MALKLATACVKIEIIKLSFWLWVLDFRFADLNVEPTSGNYFPTIFFNEFWLLRDKLIALNETVTELTLNLEVGPISMTKWQLFMQIDQSFQVHRSYGSMLEGEADELKVPLNCIQITIWSWVTGESRFCWNMIQYFYF